MFRMAFQLEQLLHVPMIRIIHEIFSELAVQRQTFSLEYGQCGFGMVLNRKPN